MRVVDIHRREDDYLAENWVYIDILYYLYQQGLDVLHYLTEQGLDVVKRMRQITRKSNTM